MHDTITVIKLKLLARSMNGTGKTSQCIFQFIHNPIDLSFFAYSQSNSYLPVGLP